MDYKKFSVSIEVTIIEAMKAMDKAARKIVFVHKFGKLEGVITDGDFRRWILKGGDIKASVSLIMNKNPIYVYRGNENLANELMIQHSIDCLPVIDRDKNIISAIFRNEAIVASHTPIELPVVIMAGGGGQRLYPLTKVLPKPLIPIGDLTIIERIANNFIDYGCTKFYLTLNYKKNIIKAYFNDLDYDVEYIVEDEPLGTGGSLYYLKDKINKTFFVSNCDILVQADYEDIYRYHKEKNNIITVVASLKNTVIPYGVIELNADGTMMSTLEKPSYSHLINTGMYVIEPRALDILKEPKFIHITDLIEQYLEQGEKVGVFPIGEDAWLDMGQIKEMENMIKQFESR